MSATESGEAHLDYWGQGGIACNRGRRSGWCKTTVPRKLLTEIADHQGEGA